MLQWIMRGTCLQTITMEDKCYASRKFDMAGIQMYDIFQPTLTIPIFLNLCIFQRGIQLQRILTFIRLDFKILPLVPFVKYTYS